MPTAIGKTLRRAEFWQEGQKSVLTDVSLPGALGPMPGLEVPTEAVSTLAPLVDGLIVNPGLAEAQAGAFVGKLGAAPLVRLDWTNAHRPADFVLAPRQIHRVSLGTAEDAVQMGACAAVVSFILGYDEDFEARNVQSISLLARECERFSLPLLAEVRPTGPKVEPAKFDGAVELGVSFMVEGGADAVSIPLPSEEALGMILEFSPVPTFLQMNDDKGLKPLVMDRDRALVEALRQGCAGLVLGSRALADPGRAVGWARAVIAKSEEEAVT
jgi:DhnA family fructose-bisphosphate aldolase class Ia